MGARAARRKCAKLPRLADVSTDQQNSGLEAGLITTATPPPASESPRVDRQHAVRRLWPAPGLHHVHAAQSIPRGDGGRAAILARPAGLGRYLCRHRQRRPGSPERIRKISGHHRAAGRQPPGPVPLRNHLLQPRPGVALGDAVDEIGEMERSIGMPATHPRQFRGHGPGLSILSVSEPMLIVAALMAVYIVLGHSVRELHSSHHHPLHAAIGRRRRGAGPADHAHRAQRHRADRHHPADWHRQKKCHLDDRFRPGGGTKRRQEPRGTRSTKPACCVFVPS